MSANRIAVYGHRGRFSSRIVSVLIASDAHITVLYRPGSDISNLPARVPKIEVDVLDQDALVAALQNIDIVLSLVGDEGVSREFGFVSAIPRTNVKLFVPSDLGLRYGEDGMAIPLLKKKEQVQEATRQAGIPLTVVLIANFAEFTLGSIYGDIEGNRLLYTGNAAIEKASMWLCGICTYSTVEYVAAAYVSIFTTTPIAEISNRAIGLYGKKPKIFQQSIEKVNEQFLDRLKSDMSALAPAWYYRKLWGTGELTSLLGSDIWDLLLPHLEEAMIH
ncbi:nmrA-like family protein [Leptodontidium sp. MPI-SDFR-AT-0119]|nr:nmrA-like family protein [Leptodontidium sp. MPI-SDFR-AT-0119]